MLLMRRLALGQPEGKAKRSAHLLKRNRARRPDAGSADRRQRLQFRSVLLLFASNAGGRGTQTANSGQIVNDARKLMNQRSLATNPGPGTIARSQARDEDTCRTNLAGLGEDASQCSDPGQAGAIAAARGGSNLAMNGSPAASMFTDPGRTGCHKLLDKIPYVGHLFQAYHNYEDVRDAIHPPPDPKPTLGSTAAADCR